MTFYSCLFKINYFLKRFYFMPMSVLTLCMYVHTCALCSRIEDVVRPPRTGCVDSCEAHGYWESTGELRARNH